MKVKIGDICTLKSGTSLKEDVLNESNGIPYIKVSDMNLVGNEKYIVRANSYADESINEKMLFPKGTVLFPKRGGAIGTNKKRIASKTVCADLNTMGVIPSDKISPLYLYYFFQNIDFATLYNGSSVPQINNTDIAPMEINLISLEEQDNIVTLLEKIDDIVRKRKKELSALDNLIKARFVEMFGDMLLNSKNWPEVRLDEIADIVSGITKGRKIKEQELFEVPYMAVSNVKDGYIDWTTVKTVMASQAEIDKYQLKPFDVLMTEGGDPDKVGRGAIIHEPPKNCIHQNHIFRVRLNRGTLLPEYMEQYLQQQKAKRYFLGCAKQTTGIASINMRQLTGLPVVVPEMQLQKEYVSFVHQVDKSKFINQLL